ncbi:MAG: hypothetical protein AAGA16_03785 [Cyanobacteria bacterium P01_E01_bin.35]
MLPKITETSTAKAQKHEPYDLEKCTIKIVMLLHPADSNKDNSDCTIAISTHDDIPLTKIVERSQLNLPEAVEELLEELKTDLPQREFHARVKQSKTSKQKTTKSNKTSSKTKAKPTKSDTSTIKQVQLF